MTMSSLSILRQVRARWHCILFLATLLLTACGGGGGGSDTPAPNPGEGDQQGETPDTPDPAPELETRDIGLYMNEILPEIRLAKPLAVATRERRLERHPWVELYNATDAPIALDGMQLRVIGDGDKSWSFPSGISIAAKTHLIVFGSGKGNLSPGGDLHAGLSLHGAEQVYLLDSDGAALDGLTTVAVPVDQSYGRYPDGGDWAYFYDNASPGEPNRSSDYTFSLNCHELSLSVGQPFQTRVYPARSVQWSSDNPRIAIDADGTLVAQENAVGANARARITATDSEGHASSCQVTIVNWTANRSSLTVVGTPNADFLLDKFDDKLYFTTPGKLFASTDGLDSATQVGIFPPTPSEPIMKKTPYGYFASSGNQIHTTQDFNQWDVSLNMRHKTLQHGFSHFFDNQDNTSYLYAGEYSVGNANAHSVYRGVDQGNGVDWEEVLYFDSLQDFFDDKTRLDTIRHIHVVVTDPYTGHVWVGTGDNNQHSRLYYSKDNGDTFTLIGIGSQKFRSLSIWFTEDYVYWNMDSELVPQHVYRIPRSVFREHGHWPSLTPEISNGNTKPGTTYLVTASNGGLPIETGGIYTENERRSLDGANRVRPVEDPQYDYSEDVAELTHASHWYHLWVKDQNNEDVLIMNTSAEGIEQYRRDGLSRTFGFKERADGSVDVQELLAMPSDTPETHTPYTQLRPHFQDAQGYVFFQGRNTAHRIYKMRLHWVDQ